MVAENMVAENVDYEQAALKVVAALRRAFPENATIVTSKGYVGHVQVKIVSEHLNGKKEQEKQGYLWDVLRTELGPEAQNVSFIIGYGTDEL